MSRGRQFSFGVTDGARYSQYWTVKTTAARPDVYLASEQTGRYLHLSLHDPSYGWHVKVTIPGRAQTVPVISTRRSPGVSCIASLLIPPAVVRYGPHGRPSVRWLRASDDPRMWATFEVLLEEPGVASKASWPGRDVGSLLVGRLTVTNGSTVVVVFAATAGTGGSATFRSNPADLVDIQAGTASGTAHAIVLGQAEDGTLWFLELSSDAGSPAIEG
jgi:hypothetical protein